MPWGGLITFSFGKVATHSMDAPLYVSTFVHTINLKKYNSLSATQKKAVDDTCTPAWAAKVYRHWAAQEHDLKAKIKNSKHNVHKIGAKELALWRKAAEPVYKQWAEAVKAKGYNAETLLAELRAELKKEGALAE